MADATQQPILPPGNQHRKSRKKPSSSGNLKLCLRTVGSKYANPLTLWSDDRHKGDHYKELKQLQAAKIRIDNNPKYNDVEWAAIYDCSGGMDRGPKLYEFWLDKGQWNQIVG
jgi:hypothetical protein